MDRIQTMEVFSRVAELGSFSRAAEQLNLPPATVTNAIQALEKHLGARLLQRTTRKVTLTDEGITYLERCTRLLAEFEDADTLFQRDQLQPRGVIRVDLPERLAHTAVIPALPDFFALYPNLQIRLSATDRFVDLVGEAVDCVVRVGALSDSSLIARRICNIEQINCAAKSYLDRHGRPQSLKDLQQHTVVNYFSSRTGRDLGWEYMEDGEPRFLKLQGQVSVASSEAYLASCIAGLGLAQIPRFGLEQLLASGAMEEVLPDFKPPPLPVSVVYAHNKHLSPRVRVFVDWIARLLAERYA
ncbi:MAG: bacterial regulatory helix-turn-helix, lysR family protein [Collimonas fungivorans]|uniref:LysR family transcriptional regulator n=1 Tax=Collimonas fungivorans TaxID=158899 RepID=UPI0026F2C21F|nr:LysR family transcriptional regulator [Collimonas fungivorans]MDB5766033.1 bacterial regulatory helix-turn-helix, lysR family protein [Collimonas fungivorans]